MSQNLRERYVNERREQAKEAPKLSVDECIKKIKRETVKLKERLISN
jgi:hypothetical protein